MPQATSDGELSGIQEAETDAGPPRAGKAGARDPERRCIVAMERRPQGEMIRFVLSPDGQVTPDLAAKLPGRGAWVTASRKHEIRRFSRLPTTTNCCGGLCSMRFTLPPRNSASRQISPGIA